jgi:phospholipid/cholesterol/gamma-HCH transport system substrate-binding protein
VRRALGIVAAVAAVGASVVVAAGARGAGGAEPGSYQVELDNAFGLIEGGDLKVAGVRAGRITAIRLDRRTKRAVVGFRIDRRGFGSLRRDVHCESRPQSLIGEYFLDCLPGTSPQKLPAGARIPVTQTSSTVAPDLVADIMREPQRERLRIIVSELGAGVAGRASELNAAIRRASPALRETDRVLKMLAAQNEVLADLAVNADTVVGDLARNRHDVGRFVTAAGKTAGVSARRRRDLADGVRRLPGFLEELRPTMASLGQVADQQAPALRDLDASSQRLTRFLELAAPFAEASRPAIRSLGEASQTGDRAVKAAGPTISLLDGFARPAPEVAKNLSMVLQHLDDRENAIEADPRSPGGKGYTGLEALLQYVYDQTTSTAIHDQNGHILKIGLFASSCSEYADAKRLKDHPELERKCASYLGPTQPGLNTEDVTRFDDSEKDKAAARPELPKLPSGAPSLPKLPSAPVPPAPLEPAPAAPKLPGVGGGEGVRAPSAVPAAPTVPGAPKAPGVPPLPIPGLPPLDPPAPGDPALPPGQVPDVPGSVGASQDQSGQGQLLDYLLRP